MKGALARLGNGRRETRLRISPTEINKWTPIVKALGLEPQ